MIKRRTLLLTATAIFSGMLLFFNSATIAYAKNSDDVESRDTKSGNKYIGGSSVEIEEDIQGDLVTGAETIEVNAVIGDNLYLAGGKVLLESDINGDAVILGGYVVINGNIYGDLRVLAGEVYINSNVVRGDVDAAASKISISENTQIEGEESIRAGEIQRNVSDNPTDLKDAGNTYFNNLEFSARDLFAGFTVIRFVLEIVFFIGGIVAAYFFIRLFPTFTEKTLATMKKEKLKSGLLGLSALIAAPFLALILLVSVVGINLFFLLAVLGLLALMISKYLSSYLIGRIILQKLEKNKTGRLLPLFLGSFVLLVVGFIPIVGFLAKLVLICIGLGAILNNKFSNLK